MANLLLDLNNHLFAQMEKLNKAKDTELASEIERSKAVAGIAKEIVSNARLALDAHVKVNDRVIMPENLPAMLKNEG